MAAMSSAVKVARSSVLKLAICVRLRYALAETLGVVTIEGVALQGVHPGRIRRASSCDCVLWKDNDLCSAGLGLLHKGSERRHITQHVRHLCVGG